MTKLIKKPTFIVSSIIIIVILISGYAYFNRTKKPDYDFIIAKRANLTQEVSVTGRVKPAESIDLAFEKSGRVSHIYVNIGNKVKMGDVLVSLENAEFAAQLAQAEAGVESAKKTLKQYQAAYEVQLAKLAELKQGARPEEIKIQEVKVENAKVNLEEAKRNMVDKIQGAYTASDDAIRNKADQLFDNPRSAPKINFALNNYQLQADLESGRLSIESTLTSWKSSLDILTISTNLTTYIGTAKTNLDQIKSFLDKAALAVNGLTTGLGLSQTTIDTYKSNISTARANVNTAATNFVAAEEKLKTAESNLTLAENELILEKAGPTTEQIAAQEAQAREAEANIASQEALIKQAEANAQNIQAQLAKTILRSPINGIVTKQEAKTGEIVSANVSVVSIISEAKFEIEANVPEVDIAKIKINDSADITLDAYGQNVVFQAKVIKIDPTETIIEGVATYKVTLQFEKEDERLKPGMTANVNILVDRRENVIAVPQRAVVTENGNKTVKILEGETIKETDVKTGLRGSDGNIEILEGVKEGDKVITFIKDKSKF